MTGAAPHQAAGAQDTFLAIVNEAKATLASQRAALAALGVTVNDADMVGEMTPLVAAVKADAGERMRVLLLALGEVGKRQALLSDAIVRPEAVETITVSAFASAMHSIRTALDLALNCSEDIADIAGANPKLADIVSNANEARRAVRLTYYYTQELNDLAALGRTIKDGQVGPYCCVRTLTQVMAGLQRIAVDAKVSLTFAGPMRPLLVRGNRALLERALTYLLLTALVSPGVKAVTCGVTAVGEEALFTITDDGPGLNLEGRARSSASLGDGQGDAADADAAGFALARRLAHALGGRLELEVRAGQGSRLTITMPLGVAPGETLTLPGSD